MLFSFFLLPFYTHRSPTQHVTWTAVGVYDHDCIARVLSLISLGILRHRMLQQHFL